jgi:amidase
MRPEEYMACDAAGLAALVHRREVTPKEVTEAAIERIEALNGRLNAVVERDFGAARAAARAMDLSAPLAGVPFLAKDMNIEVAGLHLTSSCRWLAGLPPATADAPLAARWRSAGLSLLGRTNSPEFAGDFVCEPTWRGSTQNPWDFSRSPGGSSGGAAAAVASGMVPIAHGTDSGGSIRVPAAACGLVGLKPSRGWVPVGPRHDELAGGLDVEHVLARSVRDSALMLDLTSGAEPSSRYLVKRPASSLVAALSAPLPPLRIGVALRSPDGLAPTEEIGAAVEQAAALLQKAGHSISEFRYPVSSNVGEPAGIIWMSAIAEDIDYYRGRVGREPRAEELEALTWAAVALARRCNAIDYVRARRALSAATGDMAQAFGQIDLLLLPTTATTAVSTGQIDGRTEPFDMHRWNQDSYGYAPFTEIFNVTGQPAISLPLAVSSTGLPIGVQLAAPMGEDARLLTVSAWFEREQPWDVRLSELRGRLLEQP